jgi:hypothetical protein
MSKEESFGKIYKDYSGLCEFKKMSLRKMVWPDHRKKFNKEGNSFLCRPMSNNEIEMVCDLYRMGVPECQGTNFHFLHHPKAM